MVEPNEITRDVTNPIAATNRGQEALQDLLSGLRDLMLPFYAHMDPKNRGVLCTHQALVASQQCSETIHQMKNNREILRQAFITVKQESDKLNNTNAQSLIPFVDSASHEYTDGNKSEFRALLETREQALAHHLEVTNELSRLRRVLTTVLWELNDLMDPTIVKQ
ncbi:unnamed protein product [Calicophoron daubneyi]|uniref:Mediator of RNA polymerase II transcription subunit 30 n=1 Tax=Calicophoron daubneyi TaxID=300641 RepID=A0AAV2T9I0_CALDB